MEHRFEILNQKTIEIISRVLEIPPTEIVQEKMISELSEDSIRLFELLLAFEREFAIQTAYEDVVQLKTVGDIVTYLVDHESVVI